MEKLRLSKYNKMKHINQRSLDEFIELKYMPKDMSIRLPMIPGVTDKLDSKNMLATEPVVSQ